MSLSIPSMEAAGASARVRNTSALVAFALIAGSAFLVTKEVSKSLPPCTIAASRLALGSVGLLLCNALLAGIAPTARAIALLLAQPLVLVVGCCNTAISYSLNAAAMDHGIEVWLAATLAGCAPLFTAAMALAFLPTRRPSASIVGGLLVGFAGIGALAAEKALAPGKHGATTAVGFLLQLIAVSSKAIASALAQRQMGSAGVVSRSTMPNTTPALLALQFAAAQALAGLAAALVFALVVDVSPWFGGGLHTLAPLSHGRVWPALLYLGLASSCLVRGRRRSHLSSPALRTTDCFSQWQVYVLQFYLVREVGAVQQMAVDYLTPIVGIVEGAIFRCNFCGISPLRLALVSGHMRIAVGGQQGMPKPHNGCATSALTICPRY